MLTLLSMFYYICLRRRSRSGTRGEALTSRRAVESGQRATLPISVEVEQYAKGMIIHLLLCPLARHLVQPLKIAPGVLHWS